MDRLKVDFNLQYEEKDAIGKRYRRQDAIGTPFCITVDHQTLEDNTVTIRYRDTMQQERVPADQLEKIIGELVSWKKVLNPKKVTKPLQQKSVCLKVGGLFNLLTLAYNKITCQFRISSIIKYR